MNFFYFLLPLCFLISCGESAETKQLREDNERMRVEMQRKKLEDSTLAEQSRMLAENQLKLQEQLNAQEEQKELEKLAADEPQTMRNFVIRNQTEQGTILSTGTLFEANKVRYIGWTGDFTDNMVKLGKKAYGKIYVRYMRKASNSTDGWSVLDIQGTFSKRDGTVHSYSRKYNMIYDGREQYSFGQSLGNSTGGVFGIGKWALEVFWEIENTGHSYYLGGSYFEVY